MIPKLIPSSSIWIDLPDLTTEGLNDAVDQALASLPQREELREKALKLQKVERQNIQAVARLLGLAEQS